MAPVRGFTYSVFVQVAPPSVVLKTPRSSLSVHSWPDAATYTVSGLVGWMTMRAIVNVPESPMCRQV